MGSTGFSGASEARVLNGMLIVGVTKIFWAGTKSTNDSVCRKFALTGQAKVLPAVSGPVAS